MKRRQEYFNEKSIFSVFGNTDSENQQVDLAVGETRGDIIGCYLMWFENDQKPEPSYVSVATTLERLKKDYLGFFSEIVEKKEEMLAQMPDRMPPSESFRTDGGGMSVPTTDIIRNGHEHDLTVATNCLKNPGWIEMYLKSDRSKPFIQVASLNVWIGTGARARQKLNGQYVE